jgi:hypothetical protein
LGACVIYCDDNPSLYPARPYQVRLQLDGSPIPDALLGAAVARGRELCAASGKFARLYIRCDPDDAQMLEALAPLGFDITEQVLRKIDIVDHRPPKPYNPAR